MEINKIAGIVAASAVVVGFGSIAPASAADAQVFGLQQTVNDPNGGEIGYTVTKLLPSADAIPYPVSGQLYEATVRADAFNNVVAPAIPAFSAATASGQSYPALANVWTPQGLSGMALLPGGHANGKVYFDAVGEAPTSIVYVGGGNTLAWTEPATEVVEEDVSEEEAPAEEAPAEEAAPEEEAAPDDGASDATSNEDANAEEEE